MTTGFNGPAVVVLRGDARNLPLPDASVDLICTSPPYFGLRSYQDGGEHYAGQIGAEDTPQEFLQALRECTAEWVRVLKPTGSMFVNLGDKYSPGKSLLLLSERYRIGVVDNLGLIARAVIVWDKSNAMPSSVTDRVGRSHEDWVHLTKEPQYFSAVDEIRKPHRAPTRVAGVAAIGGYDELNPLGALPGSVWEIATQPLKVPTRLAVNHHAAFPVEWPRRIILGWSPSGICVDCGEGRRPVTASLREVNDQKNVKRVLAGGGALTGGTKRSTLGDMKGTPSSVITGYACDCPEPTAPTRPAVVLDPFGGTGTTSLVASVLGRRGISVDMSSDYCRIAQWRTTDPGERARALGVPKPAPVPQGQACLSLFGEDAS